MGSIRERGLGWITLNDQEYPRRVPEDWQAAIAEGHCPFCGAGPFAVVAIHVNKRHGLNRREFRDLLGVTYETSVCHPEHSERMAANGRDVYERGLSLKVRPAAGTKRQLSEAAKQANAERARNIDPAIRAETGRRVSEQRLSETAERDTEIARRVEAGELLEHLAREFQIRSSTVRGIARRRGVWTEDGHERYGATLRGKRTASLDAATAAQKEAAKRRREAVRRRYEAGESVADLAAEREVTEKSMREYLKTAGADVPDGRATKPVRMTSLVCPICGVNFERRTSQIESNNRTRARPAPTCCSLSCGAKLRMDLKFASR